MGSKTQGLRKRVHSEAQAHMKGVRMKFLKAYIEKEGKQKAN
ncbi:hypothetical protein [Photobacterium alginatilyticum]|nr:hypothetical protein [Photobacterium alginatilyticum]